MPRGVKKNAGFSVLFESDAMAITNSGKPAIIRGSARKSELIQRLNHSDPELRMPYQKPALSEDEIEILTDWINQGAKWGTHWAYQSVNKTEIPHVNSIFNEKDFIANPIDHFIALKWKKRIFYLTTLHKKILSQEDWRLTLQVCPLNQIFLRVL